MKGKKEMKKMYEYYERAMPLLCQGLTDFRVLSEYGEVLLAAKMYQNGSLEFVTWDYDHDRKGVNHGHYYGSNYEGAKKDFAVRSGLLSECQVFEEEELKAIYQNLVFRGRHDKGITYEEEKGLQALMEKIENSLPDLQYEVSETEAHPEQGEMLP